MANAHFTAAELRALTQNDLLTMLASYIELGIDWNFEEAEVTDGRWVNGRLLRDEIKRRIKAEPTE
jgi:hypothetical protein